MYWSVNKVYLYIHIYLTCVSLDNDCFDFLVSQYGTVPWPKQCPNLGQLQDSHWCKNNQIGRQESHHNDLSASLLAWFQTYWKDLCLFQDAASTWTQSHRSGIWCRQNWKLLAPSCNPHSYTFSLPQLWLSQLIIYVYLPCFELRLDLSHSSCSSNCFFSLIYTCDVFYRCDVVDKYCNLSDVAHWLMQLSSRICKICVILGLPSTSWHGLLFHHADMLA
jgi:hypothetical protein